MSTPVPSVTVTLVDTPRTLQDFLFEIRSLGLTMYIDLRGVNLGHQGSLSLIIFYYPVPEKVYVVDAHTLGMATFTTAAHDTSPRLWLSPLTDFLEAPTTSKVFFNARVAAEVLHSLYGVEIYNVEDVQPMELASRPGGKFFADFSQCVDKDGGNIPSEVEDEWWCRTRSVEVGSLHARPLQDRVLEECVKDVVLLPSLFEVYRRRLHHEPYVRCHRKVSEAIRERRKAMCADKLTGQAREMSPEAQYVEGLQKDVEEAREMEVCETEAWEARRRTT